MATLELKNLHVALEDGTLVTETDDLDVEPLADGLEEAIEPPYRAEAGRRERGQGRSPTTRSSASRPPWRRWAATSSPAAVRA